MTRALALLFLLGCAAPPEPPAPRVVDKIVLFTIDAVRFDRLGCYGYRRRPTSPFIDRWARERALLFEHAVAQAPWTTPSLASLLSGRFPREVGAYTNRDAVSRTAPWLPAQLREAGFRTAAFSTNPVLRPAVFGRGFDTWEPESRGHKVPYAELEPQVMRWLERHAGERFFLWVHDSDPHQPPTRGNPWLHEPGWPTHDAEVRWVDQSVRRLFEKLESLRIREQVLVIVTADHGEAFGEHGIGGHQDVIYDEVLRVPLIVELPGPAVGPRRIREPVQLLDLYPTIVELLGLSPPPGLRGTSLAPLLAGEARLSRTHLFSSRYRLDGRHLLAVRDREWKLVASLPATERSREAPPSWRLDGTDARLELYRIAKDPGESRDLLTAQPEVATRLRRALTEWSREVRAAPTSDGATPPSDVERERTLRALGYLD